MPDRYHSPYIQRSFISKSLLLDLTPSQDIPNKRRLLERKLGVSASVFKRLQCLFKCRKTTQNVYFRTVCVNSKRKVSREGWVED